MRYLAEVEGKQRAELFVAWLITKSIDTHIEAAPKNPERWEFGFATKTNWPKPGWSWLRLSPSQTIPSTPPQSTRAADHQR